MRDNLTLSHTPPLIARVLISGLACITFAVCCLLLLSTGGCGMFDAGTKIATGVTEIAQGASKSLLAAYQPTEMTVDVSASATDPEYTFEVFVGNGMYTVVKMKFDGATLKVGVDSEGEGVSVSDDLRREAVAIIGNAALSDEQRKNALSRLLLEIIQQNASATATATETATATADAEAASSNATTASNPTPSEGE